MSANLQSSVTMRVSDSANATATTTINVSSFAPQGCTIHGITVETQATAAGVGTIAITGGGNDLFGGSAATTTQVARVVGAYQIPLTTTGANLSLSSSDLIIITRATANSQSDYTFYYGDYAPTTVATVVS